MHAMSKKRSRTDEKRDPKTVAFWAFMAIALVAGVAMFWGTTERTPDVAADERIEVRDLSAHTTPRLAVIGDSYSAGSNNGVTWPDLLAQKRGWSVQNAAIGGSGYVAGGEDAFPFRAGYVAEATTPDLILVVGSRNDKDEPEKIRGAATTLFADLKQKAPQAQVVVIGPIWDSTAPPAGVLRANAETRAAAEAAGLPFVDALPLGWLNDSALIQPDGVHPTDAGQQVLADRIDAVTPAVALAD
jgi:lysophospholipase L1-like esterase